MSDTSASIAGGQLRAFIERVERLEEEIKALNADKSEVYKEAKGVGFDVPTIKRVISARKLDVAERDERDTLFDLYWSAVEQPSRVHVHVREEKKYTNERPAHSAGDDGHPSTPSSDALAAGPGLQPDHSVKSEQAVAISEAEVPAFLKKPSKPLRPLCQNPDECAGVGHKHCYQCRKAAGLVEAAA